MNNHKDFCKVKVLSKSMLECVYEYVSLGVWDYMHLEKVLCTEEKSQLR